MGSERRRDIELIIAEKEKLATRAKQIAPLIPDVMGEPSAEAKAEIEAGLIDICNHLGILAGFADKSGQAQIARITDTLRISMLDQPGTYLHIVKPILLNIVGIQIDFNRPPPFKVRGIDVSLFEGKIKALFKR